jgi:hypothetical protein
MTTNYVMTMTILTLTEQEERNICFTKYMEESRSIATPSQQITQVPEAMG